MSENERKDDTTAEAGTDEGRPISNRLLWRDVRVRAELPRSEQLYLLPTVTVTQSVPMWGTLFSAHIWLWSWGVGFSVYVKGAGWYPETLGRWPGDAT